MAFPVIARGTEKEAYQLYTAERYPVGTQLIAEDGRIWRFAENGGVALLAGVLCQGTVSDPAFADIKDETIDTMAAGETVMTGCDVTTNAVAADLLKYGYLQLDRNRHRGRFRVPHQEQHAAQPHGSSGPEHDHAVHPARHRNCSGGHVLGDRESVA